MSNQPKRALAKILIRLHQGWPVIEATVLPKPSRKHGVIIRTAAGHQHLLSSVEIVIGLEQEGGVER